MSYRTLLWDVASSNHGIVTTQEADDVGVPAVELRKLASRGALKRVGHGVYQHASVTPDGFTQAAAAVAIVGRDAFLEWDSVLALYDLAQVSPPFIHVGTTRRFRGALPPHIRVTRHPHGVDTTNLVFHHAVAGVSVQNALLEAAGKIPTERVRQAIDEAHARGLMDASQVSELLNRLAAYQQSDLHLAVTP